MSEYVCFKSSVAWQNDNGDTIPAYESYCCCGGAAYDYMEKIHAVGGECYRAVGYMNGRDLYASVFNPQSAPTRYFLKVGEVDGTYILIKVEQEEENV